MISTAASSSVHSGVGQVPRPAVKLHEQRAQSEYEVWGFPSSARRATEGGGHTTRPQDILQQSSRSAHLQRHLVREPRVSPVVNCAHSRGGVRAGRARRLLLGKRGGAENGAPAVARVARLREAARLHQRAPVAPLRRRSAPAVGTREANAGGGTAGRKRRPHRVLPRALGSPTAAARRSCRSRGGCPASRCGRARRSAPPGAARGAGCPRPSPRGSGARRCRAPRPRSLPRDIVGSDREGHSAASVRAQTLAGAVRLDSTAVGSSSVAS